MTVNFNDFFFIHQSLEQPIAASCSLVRSSPIWGKPGRLPFGCSDGTRERIHLPRPYLLKLEASQNADSPPAASRLREPRRDAARQTQGPAKATPPANMVPGPGRRPPRAQGRRPAPRSLPLPPSAAAGGAVLSPLPPRGRTPPFDSRYRDGEHRNGLRPSLLEESLSCCKRVSGCPVGSTRTPAFRVGFTTVGEAEDARTRAARVKTPPRRHQPVAPLYAAAGRGSLGGRSQGARLRHPHHPSQLSPGLRCPVPH